MAQKQVIYPFFFIALFFSLTSMVPVTAFAPFLAMATYRYTLPGSLWAAAFCGLILDLLSSAPFGIFTLCYVAVTFLIYRYRIYFVEKPIGLASLAMIFSILSSLVTRIFFFLSGIVLPLTFKSTVTDFFLMTLLDGAYTLLCFSLPLILYRFMRRQWFNFLFFRKETKKKEEEELKSHVK